MKILAIETSCDETGIAIIDATGSVETGDMRFTILANELASQAALHSEYGGVYPTLAKREHIKALPIILKQALENATDQSSKRATLTTSDIDAVAVTHGPGLEPALWTGITFAQELAQKWNVPLVPVNHMEGHVLTALMESKDTKRASYKISNIKYPAITLLISGGHTELLLITAPFDYEYLGGTLDDAVGEAFDKVARMLGLAYPGGPIISELARKMRKQLKTPKQGLVVDTGKALPRPMLHSHDLNFSFSGLKTAVLYKIKEIKKQLTKTARQGLAVDEVVLSQDIVGHIAMEFEDAVAEVLAKKTLDALETTGAQSLIIGGGVSANGYINDTIAEVVHTYDSSITIYKPTPKLSGDNGLMIALAGYCRAQRGEYQQDLTDLRAHGTLKLQ